MVYFVFKNFEFYRNVLPIRRTERADGVQAVCCCRIVYRRSDCQYRIIAGRVTVRIDVDLES